MAELKVLLINNLVTSKEDPVPELKLTVTILGILILALAALLLGDYLDYKNGRKMVSINR